MGLLSRMDLAGETRQDLKEDGGCITEKQDQHDACRHGYCQESAPKMVETEKSQDLQLASWRVRGAGGLRTRWQFQSKGQRAGHPGRADASGSRLKAGERPGSQPRRRAGRGHFLSCSLCCMQACG